jgi:hypothetical protein
MVTLDFGKEDFERPEINHMRTRTQNKSEEMVNTE